MFIVFEGADGVGKTTQANLLAEYVASKGFRCTSLREPGSSYIGEMVRSVLKEQQIDDEVAMHLVHASRLQLVKETILPALARNETVISDRFAHSTVVYQGIKYFPWCYLQYERIMDLVQPDFTFVLTSQASFKQSIGEQDQMELKFPFATINYRYMRLAKYFNRDKKLVYIDVSNSSMEETHQQILGLLHNV